MRSTSSLVVCVCLAALAASSPCAAQRSSRTAAAATTPGADSGTLAPAAAARGEKSGTTATLLGIVFPGGGHYYAGEPGRGALITASAAVLGSAGLAGFGDDAEECGEGVLYGGSGSGCGGSVGPALMLLGSLAVWTYGAIDAHLAAERENAKRGLGALPRQLSPHVAAGDGGTVRVGLRLALGGPGGGAR